MDAQLTHKSPLRSRAYSVGLKRHGSTSVRGSRRDSLTKTVSPVPNGLIIVGPNHFGLFACQEPSRLLYFVSFAARMTSMLIASLSAGLAIASQSCGCQRL